MWSVTVRDAAKLYAIKRVPSEYLKALELSFKKVSKASNSTSLGFFFSIKLSRALKMLSTVCSSS